MYTRNVPFQISKYATGWGGRQHRRLPRAANTLAPPLPFPTPLLPFLSPLTHLELGDLGERCKFPQRVRAEPGHQTHFGAFRGKIEAFQGKDLLHF